MFDFSIFMYCGYKIGLDNPEALQNIKMNYLNCSINMKKLNNTRLNSQPPKGIKKKKQAYEADRK